MDFHRAGALFPLFMEHLPGGAWVKDTAGRYVYVNKYAAEHIFQRPAGAVLGLTDEQLLPAEVAEEFAHNDRRVAASRRHLQTVETLPLGEVRRYSVVDKFPILDDRREVAYVGGIAIDVTERHEAEKALAGALAEVEALKQRLQRENLYLREEIKAEHDFEGIVGESAELRAVLSQIDRVAQTDVSVLITGETGTGKELIARAIHHRSGRRDRPLIKVNCGALSASLIESELFGHEKGAFTGALKSRVGRFELAHEGTILLDEVGELAPEMQVKLLQVLQDGEFEPVGCSRTRVVDVRIIAATNRDLESGVRDGGFRADLFYRLNVLPLAMPALRERRDDIPPLADHFLARFGAENSRRFEGLTPRTLERLQRYEWPGNVRELRNVIERAAVLAPGPIVEIDHLGPGPVKTATAVPDSLAQVERAHILRVLERTQWQVYGESGAAAALELHPSTLRSRMKKLGLERPTPVENQEAARPSARREPAAT